MKAISMTTLFPLWSGIEDRVDRMETGKRRQSLTSHFLNNARFLRTCNFAPAVRVMPSFSMI